MAKNMLPLMFFAFANCLVYQGSFAQSISNVNPTINLLDGGAYYIHEVLDGQEIEAISASYYCEISEIVKSNPEIKLGLKAGMKLKIPYSDESLEAMSKSAVSGSVLGDVTPKAIESKPARTPATPILPQKKQTIIPKPQTPMQEAVALLDGFDEPTPEAPVAKVEPPKEEVKEIAKPALKEEKPEVAVEEKPEPKPVPAPKIEAPKLVVEVDEIEEEEQPEDLVDLGKSIRESLSTLEKMKKALSGEPVEEEVVTPRNLDGDEVFAINFLQDRLDERLAQDSSIKQFYLKEYFMARVDPAGQIISLRDERTITNKNTQDLVIEDVAGLYLKSYPQLSNKTAETAIGLNANVQVFHYMLKVKKNKIRVYKEQMYVEHLPKEHPHYAMIMTEAKIRDQFGKCEVLLVDGTLSTARYQQFEYNPFAELNTLIDEEKVLEIVSMKFR
jgi:hypothetical protein